MKGVPWAITIGAIGAAATSASAQGTYPEGTPLAARVFHNGLRTIVYRIQVDRVIVGPDIDAENFGPAAKGIITIPIPQITLTPGDHQIAVAAVNDIGATWSEPQVVWIVAKQQTEPAHTAPDKPSTPDIIPR